MESPVIIVVLLLGILMMLVFMTYGICGIYDLVVNKPKNPVLIDCKYKEKYEELENHLLDVIKDAEELREDFTRHDLTVSMIESEGYMRCAIEFKCILDDLKEK
jgi:hypothetical protein